MSQPDPRDPRDPRSVVITGASTGIGEACALALDRLGHRVFAGVRSEDDGRRLAEAASPRLVPLRIDVTDAESIAAAAAVVEAAAGEAGLAGLVNNAGIVVAGPLELLPIDDLRRQLEVNVIGPIAVTQAFLPLLRSGRGRIVNVGSISGRVAAPFMGPYAASKHALEALTDSLRVELRGSGILVSIVEPGNVQTPIWQKSRAAADQLAEQVSSEGNRLYSADLAAVREATGRMARTAMPVETVVRAVLHALSARRPKTRYPVGLQARLATVALKFVPDRIRDWIVRRELGLS